MDEKYNESSVDFLFFLSDVNKWMSCVCWRQIFFPTVSVCVCVCVCIYIYRCCVKNIYIQRCYVKNMFLKFRKIHRKTPVPEPLFSCSWRLRQVALLKETLAQVFYCEFCKIFKNTFFYKILPVGTSVEVFYRIIPLTKIVKFTSKNLWRRPFSKLAWSASTLIKRTLTQVYL